MTADLAVRNQWPLRYRRGSHCASTMLANALVGTPLEMPEELCFVVGGGHGFLYHREGDVHYVNSRMHDLELFFAQRTSMALDVVCHASLDRALDRARAWLADGWLTYAYCEAQELDSFHGVLPWQDVHAFGEHVLPIRAVLADGSVECHDYLWQEPLTIARDSLERAMSMPADGTLSMAAPAHRFGLGRIVLPAEAPDLDEIIPLAIRHNMETFLQPVNHTQGVQGLKGFERDLSSLPQRFPADVVAIELRSLFTTLEKIGSGGGAGRLLFSRGLGMAAEHLGSPTITASARAYRELGGAWRRLAHDALVRSAAADPRSGWSALVEEVRRLRLAEERAARELLEAADAHIGRAP